MDPLSQAQRAWHRHRNGGGTWDHTPASGFVGPLGALVIGTTAGTICFIATNFMKRVLHVDDSLDVFPVHAVGGMIGTVLTGVFAAPTLGGVGYAEGIDMGQQVTTQLIGVGVTVLWSGIITLVILGLIHSSQVKGFVGLSRGRII